MKKTFTILALMLILSFMIGCAKPKEIQKEPVTTTKEKPVVTPEPILTEVTETTETSINEVDEINKDLEDSQTEKELDDLNQVINQI